MEIKYANKKIRKIKYYKKIKSLLLHIIESKYKLQKNMMAE